MYQKINQASKLFCLIQACLLSYCSFAFSVEESVADVVSWVAIIVVPVVGIVVFLFIHVLPERIAEKRNHPQTQAIKVLCFLSLIFGGLLWPLAWLWAYSKPVFYKMAYGTDKGDYHEETVKEFKKSKEKEKDR